jgi:hypothetical protein
MQSFRPEGSAISTWHSPGAPHGSGASSTNSVAADFERTPKVELTEHLTAALDRGDNQGIIRLGAAFSYLHANEFDQAQSKLEAVAASGDFFAQYVSDVLRLHLAVARKDQQAVEMYAQKLEKAASYSPMIAEAVASLLSGMVSNAFALEANLLLAVSPEMGTAA